jgi:hypothetical protein
MRTSTAGKAIQERLLKALQSLPNSKEVKYLIEELNKREISDAAHAYLCLFFMANTYPQILNSPEVRKLCKTFFLQSTPEELHFILSNHENFRLKDLYDAFVKYALSSISKSEHSLKR